MASDVEERIIRLLTDLRDTQREEQAYRRGVIDETLGLQKRAVRLQRVGLAIVFVVLAVGVGMIALLQIAPH